MIRVVPVGRRLRGLGMVAQDAEVWMAGSGPLYRDLMGNTAFQAASVRTFQTFTKARGLYTKEIDGDFGRYSEIAWQGLLPGASGPTTVEMLEGLDAIAPTAFRPVPTRYALAIARDRYLASIGISRGNPDPGAEPEHFSLEDGSRPWDATAVRTGETGVAVDDDPGPTAVNEGGVDTSSQVTDVGTAGPTATDPYSAVDVLRKRSKWLVPAIVIASLAVVGGIVGTVVLVSRRRRRYRVRYA